MATTASGLPLFESGMVRLGGRRNGPASGRFGGFATTGNRAASADQALDYLPQLLAWDAAPASCIVTARTGNLPTLRFGHSELPLLRFLENVRLHYPGIELIADAEISADTDPYLKEHCFQGDQIFPAVLGMEAMAQVASALEETSHGPAFRNVRLSRPIIVPPGKSIVLRVAAVRRQPGVIAVVVRSSTTSFHVDHFTGECIFGACSDGDNEIDRDQSDATKNTFS